MAENQQREPEGIEEARQQMKAVQEIYVTGREDQNGEWGTFCSTEMRVHRNGRPTAKYRLQKQINLVLRSEIEGDNIPL